MFPWFPHAKRMTAALSHLALLLPFMAALTAHQVVAQNVTPRPTPLNPVEAISPGPIPPRIWQGNLPVKEARNARFEAIAGQRVVLSEHQQELFFNQLNPPNARLFYWEPGANRLFDTGETGIPGTIVPDEDHGRFIIFLHNEQRGRDIDGDGLFQYILRLYHFDTRHVLNLGAPARTSLDMEAFSSFKVSHFEYELKNDVLVYSVSNQELNLSPQPAANWHIVDIGEILKLIEDAATPTPTPTPFQPGNEPTPTPMQPGPEPTQTPTPTISLQQRADINRDGRVDFMDLLMLYRYWQQEVDQ